MSYKDITENKAASNILVTQITVKIDGISYEAEIHHSFKNCIAIKSNEVFIKKIKRNGYSLNKKYYKWKLLDTARSTLSCKSYNSPIRAFGYGDINKKVTFEIL